MIENTLTYDGVELLAKIENTRNQSIEEYGVYFSTIENFSLGQASKVEASNLGTLGGFDETYFSNNLSNLNDKMTYYFRFYVKHSGGLSLSDLQSDASFTTKINYRVPETLILSEDKISEKIVECLVSHDGNYEILNCGIYFGKNPDNLTKIEAKEWIVKGQSASYSIDLSNQELAINDLFYCQPYAVNKLGEGSGALLQMQLIRPKVYPKLSIEEIYMKDLTTGIFVGKLDDLGYGEILEYGYFINGKKIEIGKSLSINESFTVEIPMQYGKSYNIYPYAINEDGISLEPNEQCIFTAGIPGKNEADRKLVYYELEPIVSNNFKYIFLDRNLGALDTYETGSAPEDKKDAGSVFQWGRSGDGHQLWSSSTLQVSGGATYPLDEKYIGSFIANSSTYKWTPSLTGLENLWDDSDSGGINNPCPIDYRVPTKDEMSLFIQNKNRMCWPSVALFRTASSGAQNTANGYFWTSTLRTDPAPPFPYQVHAVTGVISVSSSYGGGYFVRCIRVEK